MKTVVQINSTNYASTGNIAINISKLLEKKGINTFLFCKDSVESRKHRQSNQYFMNYRIERIISDFLISLTGLRDHFNIFGTYRFIKKLKKINPSLIHIHVLHDNNINLKMFFKYLKKAKIPIVWTFHDCWSITGYCAYFDIVECSKWKTECHQCPLLEKKIDTSKIIWNQKKKLFTSLKNIIIVTPSKWLEKTVNESFLNVFEVKTINNGIDLKIFKPTESNFKKENNLENKYIILGVSNFWSYRKGLDIFVKLARDLPEEYQIVLVGTNDKIDQLLPNNIISIHRTYNQEELVKIYSCADLFVNPTREENFPTVNLEALACGIPVLTFDTGGSPEALNNKCGSIVEKDNYENLLKEIIDICKTNRYSKDDCVIEGQKYSMYDRFEDYISLYKRML